MKMIIIIIFMKKCSLLIINKITFYIYLFIINIYFYFILTFFNKLYIIFLFNYGGWGMGNGGLGIGDWAQSPIPNPQSPMNNG